MHTLRTSVIEPDGVGLDVKDRNELEGALGINSTQLGLWIFLATVAMLFAGFTSAYLVRQAGVDWQPLSPPPILWFNTVVLVLSSLTLEAGRALHSSMYGSMGVWAYGRSLTPAHARARERSPRGWLLVTGFLGVIFLLGQILAWRELAARGVYLPSNPHSSFFYILTGVHGLHLLGGVCALAYVLIEGGRTGLRLAGLDRLKLCATYWHFVGGLWLYLFMVLFVV